MKQLHILEVGAGSVAVDLRVNDVPLLTQRNPLGTKFSEVIDPWLQPGENQIEMVVDVLPPNPRWNPAQLAAVDDVNRRQVRARIGQGEGANIWSVVYESIDPATWELPIRLPKEKQVFGAPDDLPKWAWASASAELHTPELEGELFRAFIPIYRSFQSRNAGALLELATHRCRELAMALGEEIDPYRDACRRDWEQTLSSSQPKPWPKLDGPEDVLFERCWGGCLYEIKTLGRAKALSTLPNEDRLVSAYDVFLGKINGSWSWVR